MEINYISEAVEAANHAGNKARVDVDTILHLKKYTPFVNLEQRAFKNVTEKIGWVVNPANWLKILKLNCIKNKLVILQYPFYQNPIIDISIERFIKNNKIVYIVHDINALRSQDATVIKKEVLLLNEADFLIVHNKKMESILLDSGVTSRMINLELFDYLLDKMPENNYNYGKTIAFAGNLAKSDFLKNTDLTKLNLQFNLYGPNYDACKICRSNIAFCGSFPPNVIPYELKGDFGLIWDGDALDTCNGVFGEYTKYNNPHKLSLYIAAGIPVIVWKQAAIADFVEKYNIGFSVESLHDISGVIDSLTLQEYEGYKSNICKLQAKVVDGYFTKRALVEVEKILND